MEVEGATNASSEPSFQREVERGLCIPLLTHATHQRRSN